MPRTNQAPSIFKYNLKNQFYSVLWNIISLFVQPWKEEVHKQVRKKKMQQKRCLIVQKQKTPKH